jgi:predicted RNA methylase
LSKLTKPQIKAHQEACRILEKDRLNDDEREFVVENWQESATHINSAAGAFFTPLELAQSFAVEISGSAATGGRVIDLCAGIGVLALAAHWYNQGRIGELVCVEKNPDYVAVGRKVLPEARWICGDVFDLPDDLGEFTFAIANPPFGSGGPIKGVTLDLNVVAAAAPLAEYGVFILPAQSVPFEYSGRPCYRETEPGAYRAFHQRTGIRLGPSCGIDCSFAKDLWRGVAPNVEIAIADFDEWRAEKRGIAAGAGTALFGVAAE